MNSHNVQNKSGRREKQLQRHGRVVKPVFTPEEKLAIEAVDLSEELNRHIDLVIKESTVKKSKGKVICHPSISVIAQYIPRLDRIYRQLGIGGPDFSLLMTQKNHSKEVYHGGLKA